MCQLIKTNINGKLLELDDRIGYLNSGDFYCFPDGYGAHARMVRGSLQECEQALGIAHTAPLAAPVAQTTNTSPAKPKPAKKKKGTCWCWTATFTALNDCTTTFKTGDSFEVELSAADRNAAMVAAREWWRHEGWGGAYGGKVKINVRQAKPDPDIY